jgi:hypothetical protein
VLRVGGNPDSSGLQRRGRSPRSCYRYHLCKRFGSRIVARARAAVKPCSSAERALWWPVACVAGALASLSPRGSDPPTQSGNLSRGERRPRGSNPASALNECRLAARCGVNGDPAPPTGPVPFTKAFQSMAAGSSGVILPPRRTEGQEGRSRNVMRAHGWRRAGVCRQSLSCCRGSPPSVLQPGEGSACGVNTEATGNFRCATMAPSRPDCNWRSFRRR